MKAELLPILRPFCLLILLLLVWSPVSQGAPEIREKVLVPMRDGVKLATTAYLPEGDGPWPCILSRTPYNRRGLAIFMGPYTSAGYAFISQDCRGKFESEGKYDPFKSDHFDGFDTVEWVAERDWCNGKVGMVGGSAMGITSNLAATQVPPHLLCAYVIVAPASARRNTIYMGGVYRKELNDGWLLAQGAASTIAETIGQPPGSPHWDWREISDFHSTIRIPIYNVGGWFDIFTQGTLDNFTGLQESGAGLAAGNQKIVMGPWAHGNVEGRLKFPNSGNPLLPAEQLRWFDRWLKGKKNGISKEPPIRYYLLGDCDDPKAPGNEWRTADSWPPPARATSFFLHPERALSMSSPPAEGGKLTYRYDPAKPVPTCGGANLLLGGKGPKDQRDIPERQDYLRLQTAVLERPMEVVGRIWADLYVSSDAPDTDFAAKLVDVYPDGYEALIADGIIRTRYRKGIETEVFLKKDEVVPVRVDLWSTAIVFNKGHRIALHLTSSNDPRFDPNPNTGRPLRADKETRVAQNSIHFGRKFPSRLLLPVASPEARE